MVRHGRTLQVFGSQSGHLLEDKLLQRQMLERRLSFLDRAQPLRGPGEHPDREVQADGRRDGRLQGRVQQSIVSNDSRLISFLFCFTFFVCLSLFQSFNQVFFTSKQFKNYLFFI